MRILFLAILAACSPAAPSDPGGPDTATGTATAGPQTIRVLTWNIESLGNQGTADYEAIKATLMRLDADVVGLNEIDDVDVEDVKLLAAELGYDTIRVPQDNPFGDLRSALMTRLPTDAITVHDAAKLSGDNNANDLTRLPISLHLSELDLTLLVNHWKSGFDDQGEFRKCLDTLRMLQAADDASDTGRFVIMGDVNHEVTEGAGIPAVFTSVPSNTPSSFVLGQDFSDRLDANGIANDPFALLTDANIEVVQAAQLDGRLATRDVSGRRIDYLMLSPLLKDSVVNAEIYDSRDEHLSGGLPKVGEVPARELSADASDHLPVFMDITIE